ncbi:RNA polymerase III subunit RPC82 domain containing protein [Rhypophila sp. PSN 637]
MNTINVTRPVGELLSLLVEEFLGELPARIFKVLLTRGRLSAPTLAQYTSMTRRQLLHGLVVLQQHNLLHYKVDPESIHTTMYEANPENAYNLIRVGKILEMVDSTFGAAAKDVMRSLLLSGFTRISDLVAAYQEQIDEAGKATKTEPDDDDPFAEPEGVNGDAQAAKKPGLVIKSTAQLNSVICRLVEAELIEVMHDKIFLTHHDLFKGAETKVMKEFFPTGIKGNKAKVELQERIADELREDRSKSKSLKRKLEQSGAAAKRRKLFTEGGLNGAPEEETDPLLDAKQVIRINHEKCLVDLRNRRLVQFVNEMIGETTGYVYGVLLKHLTSSLPRCRTDPLIDISEEHIEQGKGFVTTDEILDSLKTAVDLSLGLGKAPRDKFSSRAAEKVQDSAPKKKIILEADVDGDASADEEENDDGDGSDSDESMADGDFKPAQANGTKVKFADGVAGDYKLDRPTQLRQHLLLLAESSQRFVRHCGPNEWTVDFVPLIQTLKEAELDSIIEQQCGRPGLRLVRILRSKGKLDEKALTNTALMRKSEIQQTMLQMLKAGFAHTQEVPKDNKADVSKSFFLWYCDANRSLDRLQVRSYKSMLNCIQFLEVLRQKEKDVLSLTKRLDVKGREKDVMRKEYYDRYSRFLEHEKRLFAQMGRLDDLITLLKDF